MHSTITKQAISFSLAALMTLAVLVAIDRQAQPDVANQQLAHLVAPKA